MPVSPGQMLQLIKFNHRSAFSFREADGQSGKARNHNPAHERLSCVKATHFKSNPPVPPVVFNNNENNKAERERETKLDGARARFFHAE